LQTALVALLDVRPEGYNFADGLMPHRARQRHAAVLQRQRFAPVAEIVAAFPDMKIAVANTGRLHLDQHLRSSGLRRRLIHFLQGGVELGDLETLHGVTPDVLAYDQTDTLAVYLGQRVMASHVLAGRHL